MNPVATDRPRRTRHAVSLVITLAALCLATACSRPVREVLFPDPAFQRFSATGAEPLATKWWTTFGDEKLNALMDRALSGNFSLMTAWDRLEQERATTASAGADQWPTLDATADASRTRTVSKLQTAGGGSQKTVTYTNSFTGTLVASYEVDLWGGVRSTLEAARRDVMAAEYDVQAAAITLTGEIATAWYELVELRGELRLLDKQKETNEKQLEIITLKFRRGHASATDVLQQRQVLEALQGRRRLVEATIAERRNRIAVLVGAVPGSIEIDTPDELPSVPPLPATGLAAEWLRRRPDIRAAEARVQAADQRVGAAIADRFPRLSLSVTTKASAEEVRNLFDNWAATIASNIAAPIIDGGKRRAEVRRTRAVVSEYLHDYAQTVLTGIEDVETALSAEARQTEYIASLDKQLALSRQASEQTLQNYIKGTMEFTRYLTALLSHQQLETTALQARRDGILKRISLYRALAGSWPLTPPEPKAK